MQTKREVLADICSLLGLPQYTTTKGSSIPKQFFEEVAVKFAIDTNLRSTEILRELLDQAQIQWEQGFDSAETPSGGGETVTLAGLLAAKVAVSALLVPLERPVSQMSSATLTTSHDWSLMPGQMVKRKSLHDKYGGVRQGGIAPSNETPNIFLFFEPAHAVSHGYLADTWEPGNENVFRYTAEGQSGDQEFTRMNKSVMQFKSSGKSLRLFRGVRGTVEYLGEYELDSLRPYDFVSSEGKDGNLRQTIVFRLLRKLLANGPGGASGEPDGISSQEDQAPAEIGKPYDWVSEENPSIAVSDPFTNNPDALDRATVAHRTTQNLVAEWLASCGLDALSPNADDPPFDIAWRHGERLYIGEVKSISVDNEMHQIRLGIGQVVDYSQQLGGVPVLILSEEPLSARWRAVCISAGVTMISVDQLEVLTFSDLEQLSS
jgi:hypothetical protein